MKPKKDPADREISRVSQREETPNVGLWTDSLYQRRYQEPETLSSQHKSMVALADRVEDPEHYLGKCIPPAPTKQDNKAKIR